MTRSLYTFTADSPRSIYTCNTYRASLSSKYGICQSLQVDAQTLDLASISLGPVSVGNVVSGVFLLGCILGMLGLVKWAMEGRMRRSRWSWGVEEGKNVGRGGEWWAKRKRAQKLEGW